jgi:hypothetical protein
MREDITKRLENLMPPPPHITDDLLVLTLQEAIDEIRRLRRELHVRDHGYPAEPHR